MSGVTREFAHDELWPLGDELQAAQPVREPHLRVVPPSAARSRWRDTKLFAGITASLILVAIFGVQLWLSISVSEGAYETRALKIEQRDLLRVERVLSQNVDKLASPQNLAENAGSLGMVQNSNPATLRLSDHVVLGDLTQRTSQVEPNLVPNATLENLPMVDAVGLMVSRNGAPAAAVSQSEPVAWDGAIPAPQTH